MKTPKAPAPPPPPAAAPTIVDASVRGARLSDKKRQQIAAGRSSRILTSGSGLAEPANTGKRILGA